MDVIEITDLVGILIKGQMVTKGSIEQLARGKFGLSDEEINVKFFQEG